MTRHQVLGTYEIRVEHAKAARNLRDHGVGFPQAAMACTDPFSVEWMDDRYEYGEERVNLLGVCEGVILHVTYVERGQYVRIISARRAARHERDHYYRQNAR
ncbi:MAG: BrnT family toxin [Rhodospirillales bacterium]|nr:BrnT family toxin [Rhodospirillales bacterium]